MTDAYDDALAHFARLAQESDPAAFQRAVYNVWCDPVEHFGGCLFDYTGGCVDMTGLVSSGFVQANPNAVKRWCGCLTQVKQHDSLFGPIEIGHEGGADLLSRIMRDPRIPASSPGTSGEERGVPANITLEDLAAFAAYQREIDTLMERPAPIWDGTKLKYVRKITL